jgi:hypothetical protein
MSAAAALVLVRDTDDERPAASETALPWVEHADPCPAVPPLPMGANLGAATASPVEGLPIPQSAVPRPCAEHLEGGSSDVDVRRYVVPRGVSLDALRGWYAGQRIAGAPWNGWEWCVDTLLSSGYEEQLVWKRGDRALFIVTGIQENAFSPVHGYPFVWVGTSEISGTPTSGSWPVC